ncbi:JmjC domain-containing protein [Haliangium sp.]|uniref:JmjC domain-containing protein n=1 Tax=Haliangium sp. TaxID=2663208 RepID=UPI003D14BF1F
MASALSALFGDFQGAAFLRDHWPARVAVGHGALERLPGFFREGPLDSLDTLVEAYRGRIEVSAGNQGQYEVFGLDAGAAVRDLGLTARFEALEDGVIPDARAWLRTLEDELSLPGGVASIMAFANAGGAGLSLHCDGYEHFVVQLVGSKTYRIKEHPTSESPGMYHTPRLDPELRHYLQCPEGLPRWRHAPADAERLTLTPGSVLFMPRGLYHETRSAEDGVAITAVIRVTAPTRAGVLLHYLDNYLLQDPAWRAPATGGWSRDPATRAAARRQLGELAAALADELPLLDVERMFDAERSTEQLIAMMDEATRVQRNPAVDLEISSIDADTLALRIRDGAGLVTYEGRFQAALEPVLRWLHERGPAFDLATLGSVFDQWDQGSLHTVLSFLIKKRALAVLPVEPSRRATT